MTYDKVKLRGFMVVHNQTPYSCHGKEERVNCCWNLANQFCEENGLPVGTVDGNDYYQQWLRLIVDEGDMYGGDRCPPGSLPTFDYSCSTRSMPPSNYQSLKYQRFDTLNRYDQERSKLSTTDLQQLGFNCMVKWMYDNETRFSKNPREEGGLTPGDLDLWAEMDMWVRQVNMFPVRFTELQIIENLEYVRKKKIDEIELRNISNQKRPESVSESDRSYDLSEFC